MITAEAADLLDGRLPEERTLIDACRPPFSFGLLLLIPVAMMITAFVLILKARPALLEGIGNATAPQVVQALDRR